MFHASVLLYLPQVQYLIILLPFLKIRSLKGESTQLLDVVDDVGEAVGVAVVLARMKSKNEGMKNDDIIEMKHKQSHLIVGTGERVGFAVGLGVVGDGVAPTGAADGEGDGLIDSVGVLVGSSLGTALGIKEGTSLGRTVG